jgi:hypothetical protein
MAAPTNPSVVGVTNIESMVDAGHELWSITTHVLIKKGTNLEVEMAKMADLMKGQAGPVDMSTLPTLMVAQKTVDLTKIS